MVMNKVDLMDGWPESNNSLKGALLIWMVENKEEVLIEEGEDILDGMETLIGNDGSEVSEDIIMDTTEIITAIVISRDLELVKAAPLFQQAGAVRLERMSRLRKSEGLINMRECLRQAKNVRKKEANRVYSGRGFEDMELKRMRS